VSAIGIDVDESFGIEIQHRQIGCE